MDPGTLIALLGKYGLPGALLALAGLFYRDFRPHIGRYIDAAAEERRENAKLVKQARELMAQQKADGPARPRSTRSRASDDGVSRR